MTLVILASLALYLVQIFIAPTLFFLRGPFAERLRDDLGPRDQPLAHALHGQRAERALANLLQNLILFLPLALLALVLGQGTHPLALLAGWTFVVARALYAPAYVFGLVPWRSVLYTIGLGATLVLAAVVATA